MHSVTELEFKTILIKRAYVCDGEHVPNLSITHCFLAVLGMTGTLPVCAYNCCLTVSHVIPSAARKYVKRPIYAILPSRH